MADMAQPQSNRMLALKNLANQLPVANSQVAQGQQASRDMQLQQAVKAAPVSANSTQAAQQTGAAAAQNAGQQMIQNAQTQVQQAGQIGQIGLQEQARGQQATLAGQQSGLKEQEMDNVQRLAQVSEKAKQELYDKQMQFQKDEQGRTYMNEGQLLDYARVNAQSDEQFKDRAQQMKQLSDRKMQAMETAYAKVSEDLKQKQAVASQQGDQALSKQLYEQQRDLDLRMQREKNDAANRNAKIDAAVGVGTAIVKGLIAGG